MTGEQRERIERHAYLASHPLAFTVGAWAAISGTAAIVLLALREPLANDSSLAILFPTWAEYVWAAAYCAGGAMLTNGIGRLSLRSEVAGCFAVAGAQLTNVYAVVVVRGPAAGFISGVGVAVAAGLLVRVVLLLRRQRRA